MYMYYFKFLGMSFIKDLGRRLQSNCLSESKTFCCNPTGKYYFYQGLMGLTPLLFVFFCLFYLVPLFSTLNYYYCAYYLHVQESESNDVLCNSFEYFSVSFSLS